MATLELKNLTKAYGSHTILHGINLQVDHGEFVVLVGPSGCGKSTLLRTLAGLEDIGSGEILVDGKRVNHLPAQERNVSMVFQSYALFPHLPVDRNISFGLEIQKRPKAEIEDKVRESAKLLNLTKYLKRYPRELSGGQRQRVAMGRAIVRQPQMFLFDEPLSNLDAKLRVDMRAEIKALHLRLKNTVVYVTHDQVEAMTMADRIVVMRDGRIEQEGSPLSLYDQPATRFVAEFLGSPSMNFLTGTYQDRRLSVADVGEIAVPELPVTSGASVTLGIRPEHVVVGEGQLEAVVTLVEATGADTFVHMDVGDYKFTALSRERLALRPTDRVKLDFDPAKIHFFDDLTGRRLEPVK